LNEFDFEGGSEMFVSIRKYKTTSPDEVLRRAGSGFVPIVRKAPGFVEYYTVNAGNDVVVSVSVFDAKAGADESNRLAADWVKQNIASLVAGPPDIMEGEARVFKK
jgi:hypothetical protein